jgi:Zn-dependent protease with chaperone function
MRMLFLTVCLLQCLAVLGQSAFKAIDTTASSGCRLVLEEEYKTKFKAANKGIMLANSAQKNIVKEIYGEIQDNFLQKIKGNNFICDDDVNPYLRSLLGEVLTKNGISPQGYKILLSRDSEVNAYNTGDGTIVVHYGLFLMVENEDELVFIISHEIGHQFLNHAKNDIEAFAQLSTSDAVIAKTKEIRKQKYGKATMANDLLKRMRYQNYDARRKKEIEADSIGAVFYKKTLRNPQAGIAALEKLKTTDEEKDSLIVADYKFIFEKNGFKVKDKYFEEEESLFVQYDKNKRIDADSLKTHPDCATRIELLKKYLDGQYSGMAAASASFTKIKQNSTYQNLVNLYNAEEYGQSLYEALKLYKHETESPVLKEIIFLNLVKLRDSRLKYTINRYVPIHDKLVNSNSLNRFISFVNNIKIADFETIITNFKP